MYYWQTTHDYIHADLDPRKGYKFVINKNCHILAAL